MKCKVTRHRDTCWSLSTVMNRFMNQIRHKLAQITLIVLYHCIKEELVFDGRELVKHFLKNYHKVQC